MRLSEWTVADVHAFFVDEDEEKLARLCIENNVDGLRLYEVFRPMSFNEVTSLHAPVLRDGFRDAEHWIDNKLDVWDEMMERKEEDKVEEKNECSACSGLNLDKVWGIEWNLFPLPNP